MEQLHYEDQQTRREAEYRESIRVLEVELAFANNEITRAAWQLNNRTAERDAAIVEVEALRTSRDEWAARAVKKNSELILSQVEVARLKEGNPCKKIFTHKHLDNKCVDEGCQSLFLEEAQAAFVDLEPCGHPKNFLMGDDYGHFACVVCQRDAAIAERDEALRFLRHAGYVRCDIQACNCDLWHANSTIRSELSASQAEVARLEAEMGEACEANKAFLKKQFELQAEVERLRKALVEIRDTKANWSENVGTYAGGETWHGFSQRLKRIAALALSPSQPPENLARAEQPKTDADHEPCIDFEKQYKELVDALCSKAWAPRDKHESVVKLAQRMKSKELQIKTMAQTCTRDDGHDGPCNGFPRDICSPGSPISEPATETGTQPKDLGSGESQGEKR